MRYFLVVGVVSDNVNAPDDFGVQACNDPVVSQAITGSCLFMSLFLCAHAAYAFCGCFGGIVVAGHVF